ncbi:MAG: RDD family protein [Campylobacterales bacterium]
MQNDLEYRLFKEELRLASIPKRAVAFIIDKILLALIVLAAMGDKFEGKDFEGVIVALNQTLVFTTAVEITYQAIFTMLYGATIGKMLLKVKVVDIQLIDNPSFGAALLRASAKFLGEALFYIGFIWALFDPFKQAWHDKFAKTMVIDAY